MNKDMLRLKSSTLTVVFFAGTQENGLHGSAMIVRKRERKKTMKGHDGLCPTPNPHLIERQHCAYCHLIERVKEHYKSKGKSEHKTYDDGYQEGWSGAIKALQQMDGLHQ